MRWRKAIVAGCLLVLAAIFAVLNISVVAARSTIPLALDARVVGKELKREKHPGKDDVCLLRLEGGRTLHVDAAVFAEVANGDTLEKRAGEEELAVNGEAISLQFSPDYHGMLIAMPAILLVMAGAAAVVCARRA